MRRVTSGFFAASASAALFLLGCDANRPLGPSSESSTLRRVTKGQTELVTLTRLPTLGSNSEALAVDEAGTTIVGQSFDRAGMLYAVKWTLQNGSWVISTLPYAGSATASGVADQGDAAGYGASVPQHAVRWPAAGGAILLDCASDAGESSAAGISADGQVVVGRSMATPAIWRVGGCRESLPTIGGTGSASARSVNGDGTIIGGYDSPGAGQDPMPVRWRMVDGQWQVEQLDSRPGAARGANGVGDLAGNVSVPCALANGCGRASVWYVNGGSLDLAPVIGGEWNVAVDINAAGEVVGYSSTNGRATAYLWSPSSGTRQLVVNGKDSEARAVSDVRADGTRLVVGMVNAVQPAVWLVRNP